MSIHVFDELSSVGLPLAGTRQVKRRDYELTYSQPLALHLVLSNRELVPAVSLRGIYGKSDAISGGED